jgi:hypothetical protein
MEKIKIIMGIYVWIAVDAIQPRKNKKKLLQLPSPMPIIPSASRNQKQRRFPKKKQKYQKNCQWVPNMRNKNRKNKIWDIVYRLIQQQNPSKLKNSNQIINNHKSYQKLQI